MSYTLRVSSLDHVPTMSSSKVAGDKQERGCEECCACEASHEFLFWFAAFIWFVGAFACLYRGYTLILEAQVYGASRDKVLYAVIPCIVMGVVLGYVMFMKLAHRNIDRIEKLVNPRWYNGFRWQFYCFLVGFDCTIFVLTEYFSNTADATLAWGALDLSVGTSLTMSFFVYLKRWRSFYDMDSYPDMDSPRGSSKGGSMTKSLLYKYEDPPRLSDHTQGQLGLNNPSSRRDSGSSTGSDPSWSTNSQQGAASPGGMFGKLTGSYIHRNASPSAEGLNADGTIAGSLRGSGDGGLPRRGSGSGRDSFNNSISGSMGTSPLIKIEEIEDYRRGDSPLKGDRAVQGQNVNQTEEIEDSRRGDMVVEEGDIESGSAIQGVDVNHNVNHNENE